MLASTAKVVNNPAGRHLEFVVSWSSRMHMPSSDYDQILQLLRQKRDQFDQAIAAIERLAAADEVGSRGNPSGSRREGAGSGGSDSPAPAQKKRSLSAAGRKAISDAAKRRWAAKRAAQSGRKTAGSKRKTAAKKQA